MPTWFLGTWSSNKFPTVKESGDVPYISFRRIHPGTLVVKMFVGTTRETWDSELSETSRVSYLYTTCDLLVKVSFSLNGERSCFQDLSVSVVVSLFLLSVSSFMSRKLGHQEYTDDVFLGRRENPFFVSFRVKETPITLVMY